MKKIILISLILCFAMLAGAKALAEDLETKEPILLPDSPFYFLKDWGRGLQSLFAFNPVKKIELKEKFANEKLLELKKLVEKNVNQEIIKKAADKYSQEMEKIRNQAEKIKDGASINPEVNKFLEKFTNQQALHQQILEKLENQVPPEVFQKIKETRKQHLERFEQVMKKLETRREKVEENMEKVCIELWDPVCGKDNKTYSNKCFAKLAGAEVAYKGECKTECKNNSDCPQPKCGKTISVKCLGAKNKCVEGKCVIESTPAECNNLKVKIDNLLKQANYCNEDSDCVDSNLYCNRLVNKNADLTKIKELGKEYGQKCYTIPTLCAQAPAPEEIMCIEKKCVVKKMTPSCKYYYWIDANNKECGYKKFCGVFMYLGLQTFSTKKECLRAVGQ